MSDLKLRNLERQAATGDLNARIAYEYTRRRIGLSEPHRLEICDVIACITWHCDPFDSKDLTKNDNVKWSAAIPNGWITVSATERKGSPLVATSYQKKGHSWSTHYAVPKKWYEENILAPKKIKDQHKKENAVIRDAKIKRSKQKLDEIREKNGLQTIEVALKRERLLRVKEYFDGDFSSFDLQKCEDELAAAISVTAATNKNIREILKITRLSHACVIEPLIEQESLKLEQLIKQKRRDIKNAKRLLAKSEKEVIEPEHQHTCIGKVCQVCINNLKQQILNKETS